MCFLIAAIISFISGILSDYLGRKNFMIIGWMIGVIGFIMSYFSS